VKVDLLIGGSQDDGLINRAKAVKVGKGRQGEASAASCWILGRERLFPWLTEDCVPRL
jgi:hypothetical protein